MYPELLPPVGTLTVLALLVTLFFCARGPVERRLALRNAVRRPGETTLVIAGSVLGTAIIIGSLVVGDTLNHSFRQTAFTSLGSADIFVTTPDYAAGDRVAESVARLSEPLIDGVLPIRSDFVAVQAGERAEPQAQLIEMDFAAASRFDAAVSGPTPGPGEAVIDEALAAQVHASAGDAVTVYLYGTERQYRVARVIPLRGVGGLADFSRAKGIFVAPDTLIEAARAGRASRPPVSITLVSNRGGVLDGAQHSHEVATLLAERLRGEPVEIATVKRDFLERAKAQGDQIGSLFLFIGSFSIVAGILLLVVIFTMLADERRPELGMMRAVGMRRSQLVRAYVMEGAGYAVCASLLGILAGLGVGRAVVEIAGRIFRSGGARAFAASSRLTFHVTGTSILNGVALGFLIAFVTVFLTSLAISRVNIIAAIRDIPAEEHPRRHRIRMAAGLVAGILLAGPFASGISRKAAVPVLLLPGVIALCLAPAVRRLVGKRAGYSLLAAAVITWNLLAGTVVKGLFRSGGTGGFIVQGVMLTTAAAVFITQNQEAIAWGLRGVTDRPTRGSLSLRLAVAYPVARRNRTGLLLLMYGVVVFTLVLLTVLSGLFSSGTGERALDVAGGYDLVGDFNTLGLGEDPASVVRSTQASEDLALVRTSLVGQASERPLSGKGEEQHLPVVAIDDALVAERFVPLQEREARFPSDTAAWRALAADPEAAIVTFVFGQQAGGGPPRRLVRPGDRIAITPVGGRTREKRIIALTGDANFEIGTFAVFVSRAGFEKDFSGAPVRPRVFMKVNPGVDAAAVAPRLESALLSRGFDAKVTLEAAQLQNQLQTQFFLLMRGYLSLGLIVGIAGLGVVMVRAVRERRREIGVLRALGFEPNTIRTAFVSEAGFVALEGILIGTVLGIVNTYTLYTNEFSRNNPGVPFRVPVAVIAILVAVTALISLLATAWPARQAGRVPPAVALRTVD